MALGACATASATRDTPTHGGPAPTDGAAAASTAWYTEVPGPVRRWAALNHSLGDALRAAHGSCEAITHALDAWTSAHGDAFRAATAAMDAWEKTADRSEARHYHELMVRDVDARVEAGVRCDKHEAARAAFDRFFDAAGFNGGD